MFRNCFIFLYRIFIIFYIHKINASKDSLNVLEEFTHHTRVWISVYDDLGLPISTTIEKHSSVHIDHISIKFNLHGQSFLLDLILNKSLFTDKYKQATTKGIYEETEKNNCYYIGKVFSRSAQGKEWLPGQHSQAAVSTCNGVRGWLWLDGRSLHIEPEGSTLIGWHYILDDKHFKKPTNRMRFETHDLKPQQRHHFARRVKRSARAEKQLDWPYDHNNQTLIIELFIVNDNHQFKKYGSDEQRVIDRTKQVVNIVNSLYRPLNIYVALVGLEVWSEVDKMPQATETSRILDNFLQHRARFINYHVHNDNAQLISGRNFDRESGEGVLGRAPIMTMCSWSHSGGIVMDQSRLVGRLAVTMAHELGHNLGMNEDSTSPGCPDGMCIMASHISDSITPTRWSEDSKEQLKDALHLHIDHCLHNLPTKLQGGPSCGNGFVEEGEDCDCGLPQDCTSKCCNAATCTFKDTAVCATGTCCDLQSCQLLPANHVCRGSKDSCDLPEFCDGVSESCPSDVFKHNGFPCLETHRQAYCFEGACRSHDSQCRLLWGSSGKQADQLCYNTFNTIGNISGNCGSNFTDRKFYVPCNLSDVLCGMLHCEHQNEKQMFWKTSTTIDIIDRKIKMSNGVIHDCKLVVYDIGVDLENAGMSPNGAQCGENKMCVSQRCRRLEDYIPELGCPYCHEHGVCNSMSQCHCDPGYAPPDCSNYGNGGSFHSNPAHPPSSNVLKNLGIGILILLILVAVVFIVVQLLVRRNYILKEFSLSNFKSSQSPKKNYYKRQHLLSKQQQPLPQLPSSFTTAVGTSNEPSTTALIYKPPPKMPFPQAPSYNPSTLPLPPPPSSQNLPPRRPPKMKLSSTSFSTNRKMADADMLKSGSTDLAKALRDLDNIDFVSERPQPFRKAPPPPPQPTTHHPPSPLKRNLTEVRDDDEDDKATAPRPSKRVHDTGTRTLPSHLNRRSKVLNKPSFKPPPPPKPKI